MLVVARERKQQEEEITASISNIGFNLEVANYSYLIKNTNKLAGFIMTYRLTRMREILVEG